ncbi:2,3-bisphosphoglycerate-dependent phosphoglycerate mutase-like [Nilaparvata lugens]|uniref:2,3-bisphosphoglycerate-dependent phosphoglycerate mutase-like n=1 Tax=Nilaparvata lugens TaxID=108931 RepID=UPI00193CDD81|nr:2,3-bisphosphoglycerate-dependent phosphoglycerate mutase-like [Nilaparvata lugens]
MKFDVVFTSLLSRAVCSAKAILDELDQKQIPIEKAWQLNERHYGHLTGMNKEKAVEQYGYKQVQLWRRSFDILPPPMSKDHFCYDVIADYFKKFGDDIHVPEVESLKTTMERVVPYWRATIAPCILSGKNVLIVSHGTVLRSLIKHIEGISDSEITNINVPTAIPFIYEFNSELKPLNQNVSW